MGLFEKIFRRPMDKAIDGFFKTLTAYCPVFTTWNGALYESELVRSAIDARARHISKLRVEINGGAQPKLKAKLLRQPNEFQTWSQFLYRTSTILDMNNTACIVPILDDFDRIDGYFTVLPTRCEIVDYHGEPYLKYYFISGETAAIELERCCILTKFQYKDDFIGSPNTALNSTMELIDINNQAIETAIKDSATYRFMASVGNFSKVDDLAKERERFRRRNFEGEGGGILLFPNTYSNIQQIKASAYTVDPSQLDQIRTNVYNYFGVNEDVLQNKAYGDEWQAFYEGAIEPFSVQFSETMTKATYTQTERAHGAAIMLTANRLQYMSTQEKLNVSSQMADRGVMNRDEIREIWNLPPLPDGQGQAYTIRGEYYLLNADGTATRHGDDITEDKDAYNK